jgi:hypothetical protein
MRLAVIRLLVQARSVLRLLVHSVPSLLFREQLFDFPVVLLDADAELEIFAGD